MSLVDYIGSVKISAAVSGLSMGSEFYSLLMAAFRFADTGNLEKLKEAFPQVHDELIKRYRAPGGALTRSEMDWLVASIRAKNDAEESDV